MIQKNISQSKNGQKPASSQTGASTRPESLPSAESLSPRPHAGLQDLQLRQAALHSGRHTAAGTRRQAQLPQVNQEGNDDIVMVHSWKL